MKIGYQGDIGSNSETAAKVYVNRMKLKDDVTLVPLVSSSNVIGALKRCEIDLGICAVKNSIGGTVLETFEAIQNEYLEHVGTEILDIHHCIFLKEENSKIGTVASHVQALKQCKNTINELFPGVKLKEVSDTAISAKHLAAGVLDNNTAIICKKEIGLSLGLYLKAENIEDNRNNRTEFRIYRNAAIDYSNGGKPNVKEKFIHAFFNDAGIGYLSKFILIASIFASFYLSRFLNWTAFETATFAGGYISALLLSLTSGTLKHKVEYSSIVGFYKYFSIPDTIKDENIQQRYETPRVVEITAVDDKLFFQGYICDKENVSLFQSTDVLMSSLHKNSGKLTYWYSNQSERGFALGGIVELSFRRKHPASKINRMVGHFMGQATKDTGSIEYLRITEAEFNALRTSDYL